MSKLGLIIAREYKNIVFKRSFIVTTLLIPVLMIVVCGVLPAMMSQVKSNDKKTVAIVDQTEFQRFQQYFVETDEYLFSVVSDVSTTDDASLHQYYTQQDGLYAVVVLPTDLVQNQRFTILSESSVAPSLASDVKNLLYEPIRNELTRAYDIEDLDAIIKGCSVHLSDRSIKWSEEGDEAISSAAISMVIGLVLAMLIYMFVLIYGAMIMNSVVEEKTNRIVEVIVSCCKPFDLMMGKIIGVALVGLTQLVIWGGVMGIATAVLGFSTMAINLNNPEMMQMAANPEAMAAMAQMQDTGMLGEIIQMIQGINFVEIFVCFLLFFIGGYLLYASLFAAFGSAVDQASDASQLTMPVMIIMVFALYAAIFSMENPDGPLAFWCSMIPFTSPILMMVRLPYDVPFYEILISLGLLYGTAFGIVWLAGRIYRTGILMYGRKFSIKEIIRWIK